MNRLTFAVLVVVMVGCGGHHEAMLSVQRDKADHRVSQERTEMQSVHRRKMETLQETTGSDGEGQKGVARFIPLYHRFGTEWLSWLAAGRPNEEGS